MQRQREKISLEILHERQVLEAERARQVKALEEKRQRELEDLEIERQKKLREQEEERRVCLQIGRSICAGESVHACASSCFPWMPDASCVYM